MPTKISMPATTQWWADYNVHTRDFPMANPFDALHQILTEDVSPGSKRINASGFISGLGVRNEMPLAYDIETLFKALAADNVCEWEKNRKNLDDTGYLMFNLTPETRAGFLQTCESLSASRILGKGAVGSTSGGGAREAEAEIAHKGSGATNGTGEGGLERTEHVETNGKIELPATESVGFHESDGVLAEGTNPQPGGSEVGHLDKNHAESGGQVNGHSTVESGALPFSEPHKNGDIRWAGDRIPRREQTQFAPKLTGDVGAFSKRIPENGGGGFRALMKSLLNDAKNGELFRR